MPSANRVSVVPPRVPAAPMVTIGLVSVPFTLNRPLCTVVLVEKLPVPDSVLHWHASPRSAVGFLIHAAGLTRDELGERVNLTMPGVCCTVGEQIAALKRVAGDKVAARIRRAPDELVARIVAGWPRRFEPKRALALGFTVEKSFDDIIRAHIADELGGRIAN